MKLGKIALSSATVLATLVSAISNSQAATLVNQAVDLVNPPYPPGEPLFQLCADEGTCKPGDTANLTTGQPEAPNINNNNNDTGFTFDQIIYQLQSPNAQWGTVTSNAFNVAISPDGKTATFSDALLPPGSGFRIDRNVSDGSSVQLSYTLASATAVPEPTTILGTLIGASVVALKRKKAA